MEKESQKWPARSPDLNWMDQFVWGYMVYEMQFHECTTRHGLRKVIKKIWREKITKEFCQRAIEHYWKGGDPNCGWWAWNGKDAEGNKTCHKPCIGHGTLAEVIKRGGDRISYGRKQDRVNED